MEVLPTEILPQIFKHLSPLDILNLAFNISAQGLFTIEAQRHFSNVKVWIGEAALGGLVQLSNHPVISQCVKMLFFRVPGDDALTCGNSKEWWTESFRPTSQIQEGPHPQQDFAEMGDFKTRPIDIAKFKYIHIYIYVYVYVLERLSSLQLLKIEINIMTLNVSLTGALTDIYIYILPRARTSLGRGLPYGFPTSSSHLLANYNSATGFAPS